MSSLLADPNTDEIKIKLFRPILFLYFKVIGKRSGLCSFSITHILKPRQVLYKAGGYRHQIRPVYVM